MSNRFQNAIVCNFVAIYKNNIIHIFTETWFDIPRHAFHNKCEDICDRHSYHLLIKYCTISLSFDNDKLN